MSLGKPSIMPIGFHGWRLLDGEAGSNLLESTLHNLSASENGDDHRYARGMLVGIVSMLMAAGMTLDDALMLCWQLAPNDVHPQRVPADWRKHFAGKLAK